MPEEMDMADFVDDRNEDNNKRGGTEMGDDEYKRVCICLSCYFFVIVSCLHQNVISLRCGLFEQLIKVINTTSAQARRGKDIQGIPWDRMNITRADYRITRLE